jgi:hypothetical protein
MKAFNISHKVMSDEEAYQRIVDYWKEHPELHDLLMFPKTWKKKRLEEIQKGKQVWSKR